MTVMKIRLIFFLLILLTITGYGQQNLRESRTIINLQKEDTTEVNALIYLGNNQSQIDSGIKYAQQGLSLAKKLNYRKGQANCFLVLAKFSDNISLAIQYSLNALEIFEKLKDKTGMASAHLLLQGNYWVAGDFTNSLYHAFTGEKIAETNNVIGNLQFPGHRLAPLFLAEIGQIYLLRNQLDSAEIYTLKSIAQNELFNGAKWDFPIYLLATIQREKGDYTSALENYRSAILLTQYANPWDTIQIFSGISTLFKKMGKLDSAIYYAQIVKNNWTSVSSEPKNLLEAINTLKESFKLKGDKDSAFKYSELGNTLTDSIYSKDKVRQLQNVTFNEQLKQQEIISSQNKYKSKVQIYSLAAGLFIVLLLAGIIWRNNHHRKKAYELLEKQKGETDFQKAAVEKTLEELKSTQKQLVQREKMASLGELTAGIAHEIQNPLNFVNNFSDVNTELIDELKTELATGITQQAIELANDIKDNEQKINHHGKRADAIVKGMLQHSRSSSGVKEPTDINALCDEYLRLSYHGLRAKDKTFNATIKTDFDNSIGKINVIPQDIGRVVLNLLSNAFYAVDEKKKQQPQGYEPTVSISTKKIDDKPDSYRVDIRVTDNGNGIPKKVVDKIFQPFFTTKPTGQGTGLGLSLSYDIIKAHGGEIKVETKEGEGVEFIIQLPL
jgi:signal transduction histidine kinase